MIEKYEIKLKEYIDKAIINWEGFNVKGWGFHSCILDAECRFHGAPKRAEIITPFGRLLISLWPGNGSQWYQPLLGYTRKWSPISWHPKNPKKRKKEIWKM